MPRPKTEKKNEQKKLFKFLLRRGTHVGIDREPKSETEGLKKNYKPGEAGVS